MSLSYNGNEYGVRQVMFLCIISLYYHLTAIAHVRRLDFFHYQNSFVAATDDDDNENDK